MPAGIDYGRGTGANTDPTNGIRFGVIPMHALGAIAYESFEGEYEKGCPHCGGDVVDFDSEEHANYKPRRAAEYACVSCERQLQNDEVYGDEPSSSTLNDAEFTAELHGDGDVFVTRSPFYTLARFCSPCAPGACYLLNPDDDGAKAYCFPHDWFDDERAPYPVYRVSDDELIYAPSEMQPTEDDGRA